MLRCGDLAVCDVVLRRLSFRIVALVVATLTTAATVGAPAGGATTALPAWSRWLHLRGVLDVAGPRSDGRLVAAVRGRLMLVDPSGKTTAFAPTYSVGAHPESYITLSPGLGVGGAHCDFARDEILALDLKSSPPGVTRIDAHGKVSQLTKVKGVSTLRGIALDTLGDFGHRLLVAAPVGKGKTRLFAVDCRGTVTTIATVPVALEGGLAIAPPSFRPYGGQLIAPDEGNGTIYAVSSRGRLSIIAKPAVPKGGDIGVEAAGFAPTTPPVAAYLADRGTPASARPHAGTDSLLRLDSAALAAAGVEPGDLLVGAEGGAVVVAVRCTTVCIATKVATGPSAAHAEGHLIIAARVTP